MANSFIDTTVAGKLTVTGDVTDGDNEASILTRVTDNYNRLVGMFCTDYGFEVTTVNGTSWTVDKATAYLVGNTLRIYLLATRNSTPEGDISAELMGKVVVQDGGKIRGGYATSMCTSATGGPMTGYANLSEYDGDTTTVNFYFSGTRSENGATQFSTYVHLPVLLNPEYY